MHTHIKFLLSRYTAEYKLLISDKFHTNHIHRSWKLKHEREFQGYEGIEISRKVTPELKSSSAFRQVVKWIDENQSLIRPSSASRIEVRCALKWTNINGSYQISMSKTYQMEEANMKLSFHLNRIPKGCGLFKVIFTFLSQSYQYSTISNG